MNDRKGQNNLQMKSQIPGIDAPPHMKNRKPRSALLKHHLCPAPWKCSKLRGTGDAKPTQDQMNKQTFLMDYPFK